VATGLEKLLEEFAAREDSLIAKLSAAVAAGDKERVFALAAALVGAEVQNDRQSISSNAIWSGIDE
jgi:hypothetical protein